ncbi:MAG: RNA polymerase sigma factor (SigM family) [Patiriisocius sp.]
MTTKEYNQSVDRYSDNIFRFILKSLRNEELAKDIVQETFIKLWLKVEEVNAEKVKSWLFTAAYRTMIDQIRKEKKYGADLEDIPTAEMSSASDNPDLNDLLHEALNTLPEKQKTVILLKDYEGYNYKEIGEMTNLSESQVKVYIYRGRKALQAYLVSIDTLI